MASQSHPSLKSDWTWKQAVAETVLSIVNERGNEAFEIEDVYAWAAELSAMFPQNRHVKQIIRKSLQQLRDSGFLFFDGDGHYRLNLGFDELVAERVRVLPSGTPTPTRRTMVRRVILRDTMLSIEIKRRYANLCQVCRQPVWLRAGKSYAEGHHLRPLGAPHNGPDSPGNIIVLCPNHHVMFDRGVVTIIPGSWMIRHVVDGVFGERSILYVEPWHRIDPDCLSYHDRQIYSMQSENPSV